MKMGFAIVAYLLTFAATPLLAQKSSPKTVTVSGGIAAGRSLVVRADQPARFVTFVVGKHPGYNPIEVISELSPDEIIAGRPMKRSRVGQLTEKQLSRFAPTNELVVVALAAAGVPRLENFVVNGRWANDLVVSDSMVADGQGLIKSLAEAVYGKDVRYAARLMPLDSTTLTVGYLGAVANVFQEYHEAPLTVSEVMIVASQTHPGITRDDVRRAISVLRESKEIVASTRSRNVGEDGLSIEIDENQYKARLWVGPQPLRVFTVGDLVAPLLLRR